MLPLWKCSWSLFLPRVRHCSLFAQQIFARHSSGLAPIQLRDYQEECIESVLSYLKNGHKRLGISLATGSGKTVIFTRLIDRVIPPTEIATQTLILAHRRELVEQAAGHCANAYPDKTIEIELGKNHASGLADITIASIQSIKSKDRIEKYDPGRFKLVLVDEAHHIVAPQYLEVLEHFGIRPPKDSAPALVGVSATLSRFDGLKLGAVIDHIVFHRDYVDMINDGWLSDVMFTTVRLKKADLEKVSLGANGDFQTGALSKAINNTENNEATVRAWLDRCSERKSTIGFCVDVQHIHDLAATFRGYGTEARFVTGNTPRKIRSETIDAFKKSEFPVLLNCGVFTEGTDIPNIDCVLLARPTKSRNLLVQMIGRGMRLSPGKTNCHVIDMVASLNTGIVTTPTLYGLDPDEIVQGAKVEDLESLREKKDREELARQELDATLRESSNSTGDHDGRPTTVTYVDYDSVADLIEDTSGERHIRAISRFSWVQTRNDTYILTSNSGNYLRIVKENDNFVVKYVMKLPSSGGKKASPYARPRTIVQGVQPLENAVHAADKFAESAFPFVSIDKNQSWRRYPASQAQIDFLNKRRAEDEQLMPENVTKGRAADMITKLKFGAKGRLNEIQTAQRSAQRKIDKQMLILQKHEELKRRETVRVGPLNE